MILDLLCALFAIEGAVANFFMWAITSPRRKLCIPMPAYVRMGFIALGVVGLLRGVHLFWLSTHPLVVAEHADLLITTTWLIMAIHFTACAFSSWRRRLKPTTWDQLFQLGIQELRERKGK